MRNEDLENLYKLYYNELYVYAFSICKDHYLSEEVISDTFYKAFLSLKDVQGNIKFWLLCVCRNLIIDSFRKNNKFSSNSIYEIDIKDVDNTINKILNTEKNKQLYSLIIELQESYKEAIVMHYFMNMKIDEIASVMGTSNGAVRNLLYRGRRKIDLLIKGGNYEF